MLIDLTAEIVDLTDHGTVTHVDLWRTGVEIGLERLVGPALVADVRGVSGRRIGRGDLRTARPLRPSDSLLVLTGWSAHRGTPGYLRHPELDAEALAWLVEQRPNFVGIDAPGLGMGKHHEYADELLCRNGVYVVENLVDLERIPGGTCRLYCFPLKRRNVNAQWARVVAESGVQDTPASAGAGSAGI